MLSPGQAVVVLGAGPIGRLLALQLARQGHPVELHDAGSPDADGAAARVAAAMLAPLAESAVTETNVVRMGQHGLTRWPELLASLALPVFFQREGTLILWHRQDRPDALRFENILHSTTTRIPDLPAAQPLDGTRITALEPALADRFHQGLYLPGEGQLDNRALLGALLHELQTLKVQLHWHSPQDPATFAADGARFVLDCRGIGARGQWPELRAVRGEVVRLHAPDVHLSRPTRLIHPRYPIYIAPKPDHVFVIGATEIETEDFSPASVRSTLELLSAAYTVHPGFGEARILELCTQCRPTLPDNLPALRRVAPHVVQVNGLYRHGFMIAPAIADAAIDWLCHDDLGLAQRLAIAVQTG
ncbi:MAG: FAD-dependent oxidoreductase [Curvibacter sp.]|nr:FAD-dependent oxidoreductase [Curvibacter sp.]